MLKSSHPIPHSKNSILIGNYNSDLRKWVRSRIFSTLVCAYNSYSISTCNACASFGELKHHFKDYQNTTITSTARGAQCCFIYTGECKPLAELKSHIHAAHI